ncbi:hypothetical protein [uncultured Psychroserpens sp.]|uniref:LA_2272 family surface repeat-containing protein n=1 Tax=uncultured Psychroserpens sp. TaxID=255436 RepID=UPI00260FE0D2|nr:hypothetical protein [uncultured Psychroserpens sp.]
MTYYFLTAISFFFCSSLFGQELQSINQKDSIPIRNIIGFSPSKAQKVNGLNINYWYNNEPSISTNGIELGVHPLGIPLTLLTITHPVKMISNAWAEMDNPEKAGYNSPGKINGIRFGIAFLDYKTINGIEFNLAGNYATTVNGISMTPLLNAHYNVNGLGLAVFGNIDAQVNGIQIGLFNKCKKLRGLQIGIWNKNGKRSLPFFNWQFKG